MNFFLRYHRLDYGTVCFLKCEPPTGGFVVGEESRGGVRALALGHVRQVAGDGKSRPGRNHTGKVERLFSFVRTHQHYVALLHGVGRPGMLLARPRLRLSFGDHLGRNARPALGSRLNTTGEGILHLIRGVAFLAPQKRHRHQSHYY